MPDTVLATLASAGNYLLFFACSFAILGVGVFCYIIVTPHKELALIRQGNIAAGLSLGGAVVGLALPLSGIAAQTARLGDLGLWGALGLVSQLAGFVLVSLFLKDVRRQIEADNRAYGALLAALSIAIGILNQGALTS